jgi:hypothetical protein
VEGKSFRRFVLLWGCQGFAYTERLGDRHCLEQLGFEAGSELVARDVWKIRVSDDSNLGGFRGIRTLLKLGFRGLRTFLKLDDRHCLELLNFDGGLELVARDLWKVRVSEDPESRAR